MEAEDRELCERIVANLESLMARRGWSQRKLAKKAGLHETQVSKVMHLLNSPTLQTIAVLASALRVDPARLLRKPR